MIIKIKGCYGGQSLNNTEDLNLEMKQDNSIEKYSDSLIEIISKQFRYKIIYDFFRLYCSNINK